MDNSAYIALTRELTLFRDVDVTAQNIANANSTGYNAEHILFNSYLTRDSNNGDSNDMAMANAAYTYRDTRSGGLTATGNSLDVAIEGDGYFTIQTPLGIRYTRAGSFQLDGNSTLVTAEGYPVLDSSGQSIQFPDDTRTVKIGSAGNIQINGEELTLLGVAQFSNPQLLERAGNSLYKADVAPSSTDNESVTIAQGTLESSNVQPVTELTHMMSLSQSVTDNAKFIEIIYDLERKTASAWTQAPSSS